MLNKKYFLSDVAAIRLLLIFLLVFYHAFAPFCGIGTWEPIYPNSAIGNLGIVYKVLGLLPHGFRLESMVFISGLLFGYTLKIHPERLSFNNCVLRKAKRILLPACIFGIVYYALFFDMSAPWYIITWKIINGCGHLWFLPMIFWCFVMTYVIAKYPLGGGKIKSQKVLIISAILSCLVLTGFFPLRLGLAIQYYIYFFLGFCVRQYNYDIKLKGNLPIALMIVLYVVCLFLSIYLNDIHIDNRIIRYSLIVASQLSHLGGALCMIVVIFTIANKKAVKDFLDKRDGLIKLSGYCYGVYIYQQFILKYIYYKTTIPTLINPYLTPWIMTLFTIALSLFLCHLTLKTKVGKFLIG